ncbi:hypothetical protein E4U21_002110 [Claviceps maximensis]|nr:hypothetical protein E4U21_002110 [Claviceps maximensis]
MAEVELAPVLFLLARPARHELEADRTKSATESPTAAAAAAAVDVVVLAAAAASVGSGSGWLVLVWGHRGVWGSVWGPRAGVQTELELVPGDGCGWDSMFNVVDLAANQDGDVTFADQLGCGCGSS